MATCMLWNTANLLWLVCYVNLCWSVCQQPSSLRSDTDEQAEPADADVPDQLSKGEVRRQQTGLLSTGTTSIAGEASAEKVTPVPDDVPEEPQKELIDANDVLKALKAFVLENNKHRIRPVALCAYSWELLSPYLYLYLYCCLQGGLLQCCGHPYHR